MHAIAVSGSGGGVTALRADISPDRFPFPYLVLYHIVELSRRRTGSDAARGAVDEGSLLFSMVHGPNAPIPEGYYMDEFLYGIQVEHRERVRRALNQLKKERYVDVQRADEADARWEITPSALANDVLGSWRRIRLDYLNQVTRTQQERVHELTAEVEDVAKRPASFHSVFNISGGIIGMLNAGQIEDVGSIGAHVTALEETGGRDVSTAFRQLTEAVIGDSEINAARKEEILDLLAEVSEQACLPAEKRKKPAILQALLSGTATSFAAAGGLATAWSTWGPELFKFLGA